MKGRREFLHRGRIRQQIASDLLDRELIERQVAIDRVDDPVAPAISIGPRIVLLVTVAVGVASHVEPMPSPPLTEVRRFEQPINEFLVGVRSLVIHKRIDFFDSRRQTKQIEIQSPNERDSIRFRRRRDPALLQLGQHKRVDRIANPIVLLHRRRRGIADRLIRPMRALRFFLGSICVGPNAALINPSSQDADLFRLELIPFRRHRCLGIESRDERDQLAAFAVTGRDDLTEVATFQQRVATVESQTGLLFLFAMTTPAELFQQRANVFREVDLTIGRRRQLFVGSQRK